MIARIRNYFMRIISFQTIRTWPLLLVLFAFFLYILNTTIQGLELSLLILIISSGLILSWLLSISSTSKWLSITISILCGISILLVRVGRLEYLLSSLLNRLLILGNQVWRWIFYSGQAPDIQSIQMVSTELGSRINTLGIRLTDWFMNVIRGNPLFDPVATAFIWGFVIWIITYWTIWFIFRRSKPILGLIPIVLLIAVSLDYTAKSAYLLVPLVGITAGLVVLVRYDYQERSWLDEKIDFAGIIWEKTLPTSFILAGGLMFFSAISPSFTIDRIKDYYTRISENNDDELARSVGIEPEPRPNPRDPRVVNVFDNMRDGGLPNQHLVGVQPDVLDQLIMIIQVEELNPSESDQAQEKKKKYYWRSLTYDQYIGIGWLSRDSTESKVDPGDRTLTSWPESYRIIRQNVAMAEDQGGLLFSAGIPLSSDKTMQVSWRLNDPDREIYDIFGVSTKAEDYWVDSLQPEASVEELREAGQYYPPWVKERYLDLPDSVSERVLALARDLTVAEPTPYDRAAAIESYLREIPYTLDVPEPPEDREITEYFLYGIKKGYCDYYATAMVVLSRAAGLPARLVTGYIGGYFDEESQSYLVSTDLAHAWVEVYFPQYGWIIFEPTGGRPEIGRPSEPIPKFSEDYTITFEPLVPMKKERNINWQLILIGLPILAITGTIIGFAADNWLLSILPAKRQLPKIFHRIQRLGRWAGIKSKTGDTSYEFLYQLKLRIKEYSQGSKNAEWLLSSAELLEEINLAYYQVLYSREHGQGLNSKATARSFRRLRKRLLYLWLLVQSYPYWIFRFLLWNSTMPYNRQYSK
jgi:transglutaminase-like putative cysteine protease